MVLAWSFPHRIMEWRSELSKKNWCSKKHHRTLQTLQPFLFKRKLGSVHISGQIKSNRFFGSQDWFLTARFCFMMDKLHFLVKRRGFKISQFQLIDNKIVSCFRRLPKQFTLAIKRSHLTRHHTRENAQRVLKCTDPLQYPASSEISYNIFSFNFHWYFLSCLIIFLA